MHLGKQWMANATRVGDLDGVPGFWPQLGCCGHLQSEPEIGRSLSLLSLIFSDSAFQTNKL